LLNAESRLSERSDLILYEKEKNWNAVKALVVGEEQEDRTLIAPQEGFV